MLIKDRKLLGELLENGQVTICKNKRLEEGELLAIANVFEDDHKRVVLQLIKGKKALNSNSRFLSMIVST